MQSAPLSTFDVSNMSRFIGFKVSFLKTAGFFLADGPIRGRGRNLD